MPDCPLTRLHMKNVGLNAVGISAFSDGLIHNTSLEHLEIGGNEVESLDNFLKLVLNGIRHPRLTTLDLTNSKITKEEMESEDDEVMRMCFW